MKRRFQFDRSFYLPKNPSAIVRSKRSAVVAYLFESAGRPCVKAFVGKQAKPALYVAYRNDERRAAAVAAFIQSCDATVARKAEAAAKRRAFRHTLKVGTLLSTSWGYDQTNVEFFEVTALIGETMVEVREIAQQVTEDGFMSGKCTPRAGQFIGKPLRKRVLEGNTLDIHGGFGYAHVHEQIEVVPGVKVGPAVRSSWYA